LEDPAEQAAGQAVARRAPARRPDPRAGLAARVAGAGRAGRGARSGGPPRTVARGGDARRRERHYGAVLHPHRVRPGARGLRDRVPARGQVAAALWRGRGQGTLRPPVAAGRGKRRRTDPLAQPAPPRRRQLQPGGGARCPGPLAGSGEPARRARRCAGVGGSVRGDRGVTSFLQLLMLPWMAWSQRMRRIIARTLLVILCLAIAGYVLLRRSAGAGPGLAHGLAVIDCLFWAAVVPRALVLANEARRLRLPVLERAAAISTV